ncbi:Spy/CpxP family protein refolding chaperone [Arcobacter sp.]|uniref:Spy/CpxP family protein refolding chaperone n=1 Tax=Arcobacter sp. TaxID=1872629 RepID=UPI003D10A928
MIKLKILALLCSFFFVFNLFADDYKEHHEKFEEYKNRFYKSSKNHLYKNFDYLNLNQNQLSSLKNVMKTYKLEYKRFYKFKMEKEKELEVLIKKDSFDELTYKKILNEINSKAMDLEINNLKKVHAILNEQQREKFSYFLEEWRVD